MFCVITVIGMLVVLGTLIVGGIKLQIYIALLGNELAGLAIPAIWFILALSCFLWFVNGRYRSDQKSGDILLQIMGSFILLGGINLCIFFIQDLCR